MFSGCLETQPASSLLPHAPPPHPSPGFLRATKCRCCSGRGGWIRSVTSSPREKSPMACSFSTPRFSHSSQNPKPLIEEPPLISCQPPGESSVLWYNVYSRQRKSFSEEQAGSRQTPQPEEETGDMGAGIEVTVGHLCEENMTNTMTPLGLAYGGNSPLLPPHPSLDESDCLEFRITSPAFLSALFHITPYFKSPRSLQFGGFFKSLKIMSSDQAKRQTHIF